MKFLSCLSLAGLFVIGGASAFGDTVTVVAPSYSGSDWQNWSASNISNTAWQTSQQVANQPYWNNSSWDGSNENVGGCLAVASSGCKVPNQPGNIPYLGQSNGHAFTDFYFDNNGPVSMTLEAQVAADAPNDILGWYNVNNPSQYGIIFDGSTAVGTTVTFTPTAEYGLVFYNGTSGIDDAFFTNSALNMNLSTFAGVDTTYQHFAVFQQSGGTYYVGAEDLPSSNTDFDYNDMVVKMSTNASAPEPSSVFLLAVGLMGFGVWKRWRKVAVAVK